MFEPCTLPTPSPHLLQEEDPESYRQRRSAL